MKMNQKIDDMRGKVSSIRYSYPNDETLFELLTTTTPILYFLTNYAGLL